MKYCAGHKPSVNGRSNKRGKRGGGEMGGFSVCSNTRIENGTQPRARVSSGQEEEVPLQP